jgi:hypothetical protein
VKSLRKDWPWQLLTLLILISIGVGLWVATSKVNYTWRWNRVPQYFVYHQETVKRVVDDGRVTQIEPAGEMTMVTVLNRFGEEEVLSCRERHLEGLPGRRPVRRRPGRLNIQMADRSVVAWSLGHPVDFCGVQHHRAVHRPADGSVPHREKHHPAPALDALC